MAQVGLNDDATSSGDIRAVNYDRVFDDKSEDSLALIARLVTPASQVLDLGTGVGVLGAHLITAKGCHVDGVERDPEYLTLSRPHYRALFVADLEADDLAAVLGGRLYNFIVCADVLEHLVDPARLLRRLPALLAPKGQILISVPNIGHATLLAELINGEFRYRPNGILDATHLRFYTRRSLGRMLADGGLTVVRHQTVHLAVDSGEFDYAAYARLPAGGRAMLDAMPDGLTKQFIVAAEPGASADENAAALGVVDFPAEAAGDELSAVRARLDAVERSRSYRLARVIGQTANLVRRLLPS